VQIFGEYALRTRQFVSNLSVFNEALSNTASYEGSYTAWHNRTANSYHKASRDPYMQESRYDIMTLSADTQERAEVIYEYATEEDDVTEDTRQGLYHVPDGPDGGSVYYEYLDSLGISPSVQKILDGAEAEAAQERYDTYRQTGSAFFADAPSSFGSVSDIAEYLSTFSAYESSAPYKSWSTAICFTRDSNIRTYTVDYTYETTELSEDGILSDVTYSGTLSMDISTDMLEGSNDPMISRIDTDEFRTAVTDGTDLTGSVTVSISTSVCFSYEYLDSLMPADFSGYENAANSV
ncbi:MAG: hypothetical protein LUE27_08330, partial [Clostridia bacterium]|nr:hypothetical protein [Clostridia bacterium]